MFEVCGRILELRRSWDEYLEICGGVVGAEGSGGQEDGIWERFRVSIEQTFGGLEMLSRGA
jgi:hypothetical protein